MTLGGKAHYAFIGTHGGVKLSPRLAPVGAAVYLPRRGAQVHNVGVTGTEQERPDWLAIVRVVHALPVIAAVGAAVGAVLRTGEHDIRVIGMDGDARHDGVVRQSVG